MPFTVRLVIGSLRRASVSRKLAGELVKIAPAALDLSEAPIADLPLYNEDLEISPPDSWGRFRQSIAASDAVLFVTPEYNRSIPAPLKNAIDVGSRPYGSNVFAGKPIAVLSHSPGSIGGFAASQSLRDILVCLNVPLLPGPEIYLNGSHRLFGDDDRLSNGPATALLQEFLSSFHQWVARHAPQKLEIAA